ncbi:PQQ-binding-like beta-propeller repeat protein [Streptomyces sp. SP17BM10]|uniref:serine/threonine-protein kinase n=1 Tax=Streptomyces sp. SP17BM10 TaxID=3002530 RepID=UPI002E76732F|nr:PQQ-binding-like beta-propeller repeat protein [Streptomyces sp. SP17BM10]MEE1782669.1 PQQ-binding-like beta-propeller repeat protein [Streptomyces sp. SP17BM10]
MRRLEPADPTWIGPYALLGRLGAGAMGSVYLGRSAGGRTVAVKLIRPELAGDARFRARFRAEVAAARAASSAFTAPVVDADTDAPVPWMATVFVPGVALDEAVRLVGAFPEHVVRILVAGIAEELKSIHAAGLTHRDLKPSNILLALDGPHIIDFGISRAADGTALTAEGAIFGTPAFMSPEQAMGRRAGPASDVFSLGSTLAYAASGGTWPFDGGHPLEVLRKVVSEEPDLAAVPGGVRLLIAACLAKAPGDRPTPRQLAASQGAGPLSPGTWLHPVLVSAIEEAAAVMTPVAAPAPLPPPPVAPTGPQPLVTTAGSAAGSPTVRLGHTTPPPRPGRRKVLLGLAGGAVALAGAGTALYLTRTTGQREQSQDFPGSQNPPPTPVADPSDYTRSLETTVAATPLWTSPVPEPLIQVTGDGDTIVAAGMKSVWAIDRAGQQRWQPLTNYSSPHGIGGGDSPVAVGGGTAYVIGYTSPGDLSYVFKAVDLATGTVTWTLPKPDLRIGASASVVGLLDGLVYVRGDASLFDPKDPLKYRYGADFVWAVDPAARRIRWQNLHQRDEVGSQGRLYLPSSGSRLLFESASYNLETLKKAGRLEALDAGDGGKSLWQQLAPGTGAVITNLSFFCDGPHSSAAGRFLYLADRLYAVDPADGKVVWQSPGEWAFQTAVASTDGATVYAAGTHYAKVRTVVQALDAKTGAVRWSGSLPMGMLQDMAAHFSDDTLYIWIHGKVWALDPVTGSPRWTFDFHASGGTSTPVPFWASGGRIYGPTDNGLAAIAADGKPAHS